MAKRKWIVEKKVAGKWVFWGMFSEDFIPQLCAEFSKFVLEEDTSIWKKVRIREVRNDSN